MNDRTAELGTTPIWRLLVRYSLPAMFAMFVTSMYNVVDSIFIGQGVGTLALGGLALSFPIQMLVMAVGMMVGVGSASIVSRSLGAGDRRRAERTAGTSFIVVATLAGLMALIGLTFLEPLLRVFGATEAILPYAVDYLSIVLFGTVFFATGVSTNVIVRAEGNVRVAMFSMVIGAVVNLILDPVFIFGMKLGIRGAAIATLIANICTFSYLAQYFLRGQSTLKITRKDLLPHFPVLPEVFKIGVSAFVPMMAGSLIMIPIYHAIRKHGGEVHFAIGGVANRSIMVFFMPIFGLIQGLQPIVGFNYGAGKYDRVLEAIRKAIFSATLLSTVAFLTLMFATESILSVFNSEPDFVEKGVPIVRIWILMMPLGGFQLVGSSIFQALGKARPAFILNISRQALLFPLALTLPGIFGLEGLWYSFPTSDFLAIIITGIWVTAELRHLRRESVAQLARQKIVRGKAVG